MASYHLAERGVARRCGVRHTDEVWEVRLLGPVRITDGTRDVPLAGAKARAILAVLALASPRVVPVDVLVSAVWGDRPPATAHNTVQVYVSGLRRALSETPSSIERAGSGYRFVAGGTGVDAVTFLSRVEEGRATLRAGRVAEADRLLEDALRLWDSAALCGLEDLPCHAETTESLAAVRLTALLERADCLLRRREPAQAVELARSAVALRPYDESAWAVLAAAQYHAGRQAEALQTCRRIRAILADELGLDPSSELRTVEEQVLRQTLPVPWADGTDDAGDDDGGDCDLLEAGESAERRGAPRPGPGGTLPRLPVPFVGRDRLVEQVLQAIGTHPVVSLVGLGGIGKTTVALAVARELAAGGRPVAFCELVAETDHRSARERLCRELAVDEDQGLAEHLPAGSVLILDNVEQVEGIAGLVSDLVREGVPTVVLTSRQPVRVRAEHVVPVGPLDVGDGQDGPSPAAELLLARRGAAADDRSEQAAAEEVGELLDGIPLAIELLASRAGTAPTATLARHLAEGVEQVLQEARLADVPVRQASLSTVITSTVEALSPAARRTARLLTGCRGWTTTDLLRRALDGQPHSWDPLDAVGDLVGTGLARQAADGRVRLLVPVRSWVRDLLGEDDDRLLDAVTALVLEEADLMDGEHPQPAVDRMGADHETLVACLEHATQVGRPGAAATVLVALARYWLLSGRIPEGSRRMEAALGLPGHSVPDAVQLALLVGTHASYQGRPDSVPVLTAALADAADTGAPLNRILVNAWCCLAAAQAAQRDDASATASASRAAEVAGQSGNPALVSLARDLRAHVAAVTGDAETGLRLTLDGLAEARRSGDDYARVSLLCGATDSLLDLARPEEAVALAEEAFEQARSLRSPALMSSVLLLTGCARAGVERLPQAQGCLVAALRSRSEVGGAATHTADALSGLAVVLSAWHEDEQVARLVGAAQAVLTDAGLPDRLRLAPFLLDRLTAPRERLGQARWDAEVLRGGAAPDRVIAGIIGVR